MSMWEGYRNSPWEWWIEMDLVDRWPLSVQPGHNTGTNAVECDDISLLGLNEPARSAWVLIQWYRRKWLEVTLRLCWVFGLELDFQHVWQIQRTGPASSPHHGRLIQFAVQYSVLCENSFNSIRNPLRLTDVPSNFYCVRWIRIDWVGKRRSGVLAWCG